MRQRNKGVVCTAVPGRTRKLSRRTGASPRARVRHTSRACMGGPFAGLSLALTLQPPHAETLPFVVQGQVGRYVGWRWVPA